MKLTIEKFLLIIIAILILFNLYSQYQIKEQNQKYFNLKLSIQQKEIMRLLGVVKSNKDSVFSIEKQIIEIKTNNEKIQEKITKTDNVDSLIAIYYNLRARDKSD